MYFLVNLFVLEANLCCEQSDGGLPLLLYGPEKIHI